MPLLESGVDRQTNGFSTSGQLPGLFVLHLWKDGCLTDYELSDFATVMLIRSLILGLPAGTHLDYEQLKRPLDSFNVAGALNSV